MYNISEIIEALGKHPDSSAVGVLEEIGTNCSDNEVRKMTAKALIERNTHESLKILLINRGKGIHDYQKDVFEDVTGLLKNMTDKSEVIKILNDTINLHSDMDVKSRAKTIKELLSV